ncbi:MAG: TetR family transcriptional regulator [uncultured bacterium]|nr:MAG: TetR family transcriptional regulator [uncultured bacterium]
MTGRKAGIGSRRLATQQAGEKSSEKAGKMTVKISDEKNSLAGENHDALSARASIKSERKIVRRKSGEQRQNQILETARDLIFTEGFSNFTIREVASRIGISEAAIYRHFASKEELMLALLEALFNPWREAISKLVDEKLPFARKLEELFHLHLHHLLNERLNPVLFFSEAINPQNQRLLAVMRHNLAFLGQSVAAIVRTGLKMKQVKLDVQPEALVAAVLGLLQTSVIRWTLQRSTDGLLEDGASNIAELARLVSNNEAKK